LVTLGGGKKGRHFEFLNKWAVALWRFQTKLPGVKMLIKHTEAYYKKNIALCQPEEAKRIIAIFKKAYSNLG